MNVIATPPHAVLLSLVIPLFDEQDVVDILIPALIEQVEPTGLDFELVCVDDGSSDGTLSRLYRHTDNDTRVRVVALSRNFGKEAAMAAGLRVARGDAVLFIDADLQHPPELIPRMLELWQSGYDVVNAVKERRARESLVYRALAGVFNRLMGDAAHADFRGASDYKLLDRQVADVIRGLPETRRFFRGLVAWSGFRTVQVPFSVQERAAGKTKWSPLSLIRYSVRNLLAFSEMPLRAIAAVGFGTLIFSALLALWQVFRFVTGNTLSGFTTVILLQLFLDGLLLSGVGIVAVYLAEMYAEIKQRPQFVIRRPRAAEQEIAVIAPRENDCSRPDANSVTADSRERL